MKTQSLSKRAYSVWNGTKTYTHKQSKHPTLIKLKIIIKGYVNPYENLSNHKGESKFWGKKMVVF